MSSTFNRFCIASAANPPCKDCKDRHVTVTENCHCTCKRYLAFKKTMAESKAKNNPYYERLHGGK